jgi:hypothetical protein
LGGHLRFSRIDGFSGFMVIPMGEGRMLTAFVVMGYGVFVWNFMPFGLQGGPSTYSKLMWQLCHPYVNDRFQVYLDNLEIGDGKQQIHGRAITDSEAIDAQLDQLEFTIFPIFRHANMSINAGRSLLLSRKKKTLGHVLSRRGMSKSPELVSKVKSLLRAPITKPEQVEKVFACLRYMARYIPNLAWKAKFLSDKLRGWRSYVDPPPGTVLPKGRKKIKRINPDYSFTWNDEDTNKLSLLCEELDAEITLQVLKPGYPLVVIVDASCGKWWSREKGRKEDTLYCDVSRVYIRAPKPYPQPSSINPLNPHHNPPKISSSSNSKKQTPLSEKISPAPRAL